MTHVFVQVPTLQTQQTGCGGVGDSMTLSAGMSGAIRIFKPGFFDITPPPEFEEEYGLTSSIG